MAHVAPRNKQPEIRRGCDFRADLAPTSPRRFSPAPPYLSHLLQCKQQAGLGLGGNPSVLGVAGDKEARKEERPWERVWPRP